MVFVSGIFTSNARAASPTLSIVSPANNAVIGNGSPVAIIFVVSNFNLTEPGSGASSASAGHVEVFVDGGLTAKVSVDSFRLSLDSGSHAIRLRLVTDNGTALSPDVAASVSVMVTHGPAGGRPGISITSPNEGGVVGTDLAISYRVTNFILVPPGGRSAPNEGHIHVFVDGSFYQDLTNYQPVHLGLNDGIHNVTFQLVDNLHQPLSPGVSVSVDFSVHALLGRVIPVEYTPYFAVTNLLLAFAIIALMYRKLEAVR
jgi:hypothetical protein